jgi:hypothetical protein
MKKKKLKRELRALATRHDSLAETVRRLAAHIDFLAVAARSPDVVSAADLDAAIAGIHQAHTELIHSTRTPAR